MGQRPIPAVATPIAPMGSRAKTTIALACHHSLMACADSGGRLFSLFGVIGRFAAKMTRDWDELPSAARRCVFTAHGPRDDLWQGGSSGCPGLWPGGDLALNMAFHNDVAVACPHRRTSTRCRTTHFHRAGWTVTRRP